MKSGKILLILVAAVAVGLSLLNASWLAPAPTGRLTLVAHRGIAQSVDPAHAGDRCPARHIQASDHKYIENTIFSMHGAIAEGARGLALDVQASADGHAMVFRDPTLECRTDGRGRVSDRVVDYLKTLDMGFGYSADGGRTFPLRGRGIGAMPTVAEVVRAFPREPLIFTLADAQAADALVRDFARAGAAIGANHSFAGPAEALARLRLHAPAARIIDRAASAACLDEYRRVGWMGRIPASCRDIRLVLPHRGGWTLWGWPYRFLDRMAGAGADFLVVGDVKDPGLVGLDRPEQLGEVPRHYRGLLLIEDMYHVGRALGG